MCEPVSLTMAGVAVAGAGASIYGQTQQHEAAQQVEDQKAEAVNEQITETRKRATADYLATVQDEQLAQAQEHQALVEKKVDLAKAERSGRATATVAAAESGVAGQTLLDIQNDYRLQMDQTAARLGVNQDNQDYQHKRNIDAAGTVYTNRADSIKPYQKNPVKPVDYFGPIFSAAGQGLNAGVATGAFFAKPPTGAA